jgi:hypothetical protein
MPDADEATYRENVDSYRTAVSHEAQQDASTHRDEAALQVDVGEQVASLSGSLHKANAKISRAQALLDHWVPLEARHGTHSMDCYQWHPDCLVAAVSAALDEAPDG